MTTTRTGHDFFRSFYGVIIVMSENIYPVNVLAVPNES